MARQRKSGVELATLLSLSQQSTSRRLNAETDLSLDELALAADWLGISITQLLPSASKELAS